jgi:hypothetical protein
MMEPRDAHAGNFVPTKSRHEPKFGSSTTKSAIFMKNPDILTNESGSAFG